MFLAVHAMWHFLYLVVLWLACADLAARAVSQATLDAGLMVFVDVADPTPLSHSEPSVVYFGPGVHVVPGGFIALRSDTTTYLAPGAVVLAKVVASNVKNVTLKGGGILAAEWLPGAPLPFSCHHCGCPGDHGSCPPHVIYI